MLRLSGCPSLTVLALLLAACAPPERRAYVERLGEDTLSVEVFAETGDGFEGDLLIRSPQTLVAHYAATRAADGTLAHLTVAWKTPPTNPDGPPPQGFDVTLDAGQATIARWGGARADTVTIDVPPGTLPVPAKLPVPFAFLEQALRQARAHGDSPYEVPFLYAGRGARITSRALSWAGDTLTLDFFGMPMRAGLDAAGRVAWRSGAETTLKVEGRPAAGLDLAALADAYAARDARGAGMGVASPEATVEATVGPAHLTVVYSRPARRGRAIWGGLVPYGRWWRTGANAATAFTTDHDLLLGDTRVPAGRYTLFSRFTPDDAHLIVNRQTGQWGTVYDPAQDLARIPLTRHVLDAPVERFTIALEPAGDGGTLALSWDTLQFSVPVRVP